MVRDGGESRVAMMAAAAEDGCSGQRWQQWTATGRTTTAHMAEDGGMQDQVAKFNGEGTTVARDGRDSRVAIMAKAVRNSSGGQ